MKKETLLSYGKDAMKRYGSFVIEERSLPDFRDGLKPGSQQTLLITVSSISSECHERVLYSNADVTCRLAVRLEVTFP